MEILIATQNKHKMEELQLILTGHHLLSPVDLSINFVFEETGTTFLENSLGKARALFNLTGKPVLADDSGLIVPALGGEPGVYSARYGAKPGEENLEASERNTYLLNKMDGITDRSALFTCCITFILNPYRIFTVQESVEGMITHAPSGSNGFGYDPLFFLASYNKTVAELPEAEKNKISHRAVAGKRMAALIQTLENSHGN